MNKALIQENLQNNKTPQIKFKLKSEAKIKITGSEILKEHNIPNVGIINVVFIHYEYLNSARNEVISKILYKSGDVIYYTYHLGLNNGWRHFKTIYTKNTKN